ncbi:capsular polysaccharide biosynthesis protein [Dehalobacter sp. DCA]|nr:capsular polysaccharide biosynthesis protein [Dehalobacter sp. DCA]
MDFQSVFFSMIRKWWLIVLLVAVGGGAGYLTSQLTKPIYEADTKLYIQIDQGMMNESFVEQYSKILSSRTITSVITNDIKRYDIDEIQLMSMITIEIEKDSNVFTIKAQNSSPYIAATVANVTSQVFMDQINKIANINAVAILDKAQVPKDPLSNHMPVKTLLGIFLGLILSISIIYLIEYFDTSIRSAKDIEEELNLYVIGLIPEHDIR